MGREIERQMLEGFRRQGFPFEKYQEPVVTIYDNGAGDYLGVIILWREQGAPPIPKGTLALLESLRPFMRYIFSALVSRHYYFRMKAN